MNSSEKYRCVKMDLYNLKDSIFKRLEELGLHSYDTGNRRKWYYSNPDLHNNGYVEEETEIQIVFVDWMGSMTEMWVTHDFSLHPVWYKIIKNDSGTKGPRKFGLDDKEKMFDYIAEQIRQLDRLVIKKNEKLSEDRKRRKKEEIKKAAINWNV